MGSTVPEFQETLIENAPTFLDEANDHEHFDFDLQWIKAFPRPALFTTGGQSPPTFAPVVANLAQVLPQAEVVTFSGAGHIPHVTHPDAYVEAITRFTHKQQKIRDTDVGRSCNRMIRRTLRASSHTFVATAHCKRQASKLN